MNQLQENHMSEMFSMSLMVVFYTIEYHGPRGSTYESVIHLYVRCVTQKYSAVAIVLIRYI